MDDDFMFLWAWEVEGGRTGALMCYRCGATVIVHPSVDARQLHLDWHAGLAGEESA